MKENTNAPIYTLTGIVIHGRGIGKHVGTPTANMEIAKNTFLPKGSRFIVNAPTAAKSRRLKNRPRYKREMLLSPNILARVNPSACGI